MTWKEWLQTKTFKREIGAILIVFTMWLGWIGDAQMAEIFIGPSFLFAAAAFGLDSVAKQMGAARREQRIGSVEGPTTVNFNRTGPDDV